MRTRYLTTAALIALWGCYGSDDSAAPTAGADTGGGSVDPAVGGQSPEGGADAGGAAAGGSDGGAAPQPCSSDADCDDQNACTADTCAAGLCANDLIPVEDSDHCTLDYCDPATGMHHPPVTVDDGDPCTFDQCSPVGITHDTSFWDDQNICTVDSCDSQTGVVSHEPMSADDGNACTVDSCDPQFGLMHAELMCDDADACTENLCESTTGCAFPAILYFADDFSSDKGWTMGGPLGLFMIDVAEASTDDSPGWVPDPASDHTSGADNHLLGALIGGTLPLSPQAGVEFAESPKIDLSHLQTELWLEFWGQLNIAGDGYDAAVLVWDGSGWVRVFYADYPVVEHTFSRYRIDVTPYANAEFRIRFAHGSDGSPGTAQVGGWSVDDVRLLPYAHCP